MAQKKNLTQLSNELTYHRYMMNHKHVAGLFKDITIPEYIALQHIARSISGNGNNLARTYLKDIAEELEISIAQASRTVRNRRDRGLVSWEHDGNGSDGTYVTITASGMLLMEKQQGIIKNYYSRVIKTFGEDRLNSLLQLMTELENAMECELNSKGDVVNDG